MTSVADLFASAGVSDSRVSAWGQPVPLDRPGLYIISTSEDPTSAQGLDECPLDMAAVDRLLSIRPELTVDDLRPSADDLRTRFGQMWPSGETVIYVGLAAGQTVATRVRQYVQTEIGARGPHSGGWPLKMLGGSVPLFVHHAPHDDPNQAERDAIDAFMDGVPPATRATLIDPSTPLPFANLEVPGGQRKRHGIRGARAPKTLPTPRTTPPKMVAFQPREQNVRSTNAKQGTFSAETMALIERVAAASPLIHTVSQNKPNRIVAVQASGVTVETDASKGSSSGSAMTPAWMIEVAWAHLRATGKLEQTYLQATEGLNVKRSAFVMALLARFPGVTVTLGPACLHYRAPVA